MLLLITGDTLVKDVQQEFAKIYPYLKLEFFRNNGVQKDQAIKQNQIKHDQKLSQAKGRNIKNGNLLIEDTMSVSDLEKAFKEKFGLLAQVFRKSGNIWLETSVTDCWSLKQQNKTGEEISSAKRETDNEEEDYDLSRNSD